MPERRKAYLAGRRSQSDGAVFIRPYRARIANKEASSFEIKIDIPRRDADLGKAALKDEQLHQCFVCAWNPTVPCW